MVLEPFIFMVKALLKMYLYSPASFSCKSIVLIKNLNAYNFCSGSAFFMKFFWKYFFQLVLCFSVNKNSKSLHKLFFKIVKINSGNVYCSNIKMWGPSSNGRASDSHWKGTGILVLYPGSQLVKIIHLLMNHYTRKKLQFV